MRKVRGNQKESRWAAITKGLGKWVGNAALGFMILASVLGLLLPYAFNCKWVMVLSSSMNPALKCGGLALTQPIDPSTVKVGDIITFRNPSKEGAITAHRVIEAREGKSPSFCTKGDAVEEVDEYPVRAEDVTGKVRFHIPYLGYSIDYVRNFLSTPLGFGLFVGLPAALIIGIEARNIFSALNPKMRRIERRKEVEKKRMGRIKRRRKVIL